MSNHTSLARHLLSFKASRIHLVGACGLGMAGLAFHLKARGFKISACDISHNRMAIWLQKHGIFVKRGHAPSHLLDVDWVVVSSAVRKETPEITHALNAGIPVLQRGAVLAALLMDYYSIIVSGSHGKTTTTAMIAQVLTSCGLSPSFYIGGESEALGGVAGIGESEIMVAEADESDGTLVCYKPDMAVILNIEFDHADFFKSMDDLVHSYKTMIKNVKDRIIYCADDLVTRRLCEARKDSFCYGFDTASELCARDYNEHNGVSRFAVTLRGEKLGKLSLPATGCHNVLNSLATCAVAIAKDVKFTNVQTGLNKFQMVRRRFEKIVNNEENVVISDYAHHPSEISALMASASSLVCARRIVVFQPHRFSRTKALGRDFPSAFKGADEVILTPVYAASEKPFSGGTSWDLYAHFRNSGHTKVSCARSLIQAWNYLRGELLNGDIILIAGAGDVAGIADWAKTASAHGRLSDGKRVSQWAEELKTLNLHTTDIRTREPMSGKTTLRVGGRSDIFAQVGCQDDLIRLIEWSSRRKVPTRIIGAGSNILVSDLGFRGMIIRLSKKGFGLIREDADGCIIAGSAVQLNTIVSWLVEHEKSGMLFLSGIPGTVGGALRMNAGAWGSTIEKCTAWVKVLNRDGSTEKLEKKNLCFDYRKCDSLRGRVILEAGFKVKKAKPADTENNLACIAKKREWMKGSRSAGSIFKNPKNDFAGRLIEQACFKGLRIGGARISELHANHIVTEPGATASDVNALIEIIKNEVKTRSGIMLSKEIVCLE